MPDVFVGGCLWRLVRSLPPLKLQLQGSCEPLDMGAGNAGSLLGLPYARGY